MPDREKVIKGLSELEGFLFSEYGKVSADEANIWYDRFLLVSDALALLKEQKAVEPIEVEDNDLYAWSPDDAHWFCGKCEGEISKEYKYCPNCGREVKWDA